MVFTLLALPWLLPLLTASKKEEISYDAVAEMKKELDQAVLFESGLNETSVEMDHRRAWIHHHIEKMKSKLEKAEKTHF